MLRMDRDQQAAQWLRAHSILRPELLERALQQARALHQPLTEFLLSRQLLSHEQYGQLSQSLTQSPSGSAASNALRGYEGMERYEILEEIGQGGMGRVFRGKVRETGAPVVIKTLLKMGGSGTTLERFQREGLALARLSHPNIARVHDFRASKSHSGETRPYLVMEHISGETLQQFFDARRDPSSLAVTDEALIQSIFIPLAKALIHCHKNGLIHRDFKPENVLIEPPLDGEGPRPRLIDFGLVRIEKESLRASLELSERLTQSGQMMGSPAFAAPEQIHGQTELFSEAIDVWGFGATLYWVISNELPYRARSLMALFSAAEKSNPKPLRTLSMDCPPWLDALCEQCLQRNPSERPTMTQVLEILEGRLDTQSKSSRAPRFVGALFVLSFIIVAFFQFRDRDKPELVLEDYPRSSRLKQARLTGRILDEHPSRLWIQAKESAKLSEAKSYLVGEDGAFRVKIALDDGLNEFEIWAEDQSGQKSPREALTITCDRVAPKLRSLNYPKTSFEDKVVLKGEVSEALTLTVGSFHKEVSKDRFELELPLKLGQNRFTVVAQDPAGNTTSKSISIFRKKVYHALPVDAKSAPAGWILGFAAAIKKVPARSRLCLYPGTYSGDIDIDKTIEIVGIGDRAKIIVSSSGRPIRLTAPKIRLKNIRFVATGSRGNGDAMEVQSHHCVIEECSFWSEFARGLTVGNFGNNLDPRAKRGHLRGTQIIRCEMSRCRSYGLFVNASSSVLAKDSKLQNNGGAAQIRSRSSIRFQNCLFKDNLLGITTGYLTNLEFTDCKFQTNRGTALNITDGSKATLQKTQFLGSRYVQPSHHYPSIKCHQQGEIKMIDCVLKNGCGAGIHAEANGRAHLINCQIVNNKEAGVRALKSGQIILERCQLKGNRVPMKSIKSGTIIKR